MDQLTKQEVEEYCITLAEGSKCVKRKVGAVLTLPQDGKYTILVTGRNYNPDGSSCELEDGTTKESVVHAEAACILEARASRFALSGKSVLDDPDLEGRLVMFISHFPCDKCKTLLNKCKISFIVCESFMKFDKQKPRMALVPASLGIACANALTYGAKKYKPNNWRKTDSIEQYISALTRHLDAWREGEENDPESGLSHLDHISANLCFLIELKNLPKIKMK